MNTDELKALIALLSADNVGPRRAKRLLDSFGSASEVLGASFEMLVSVEDIGEATARAIQGCHNKLSYAEKVLAACDKQGVTIRQIDDASYPDWLREIPDPPLLLYSIGCLTVDCRRSIAIVGSRLATDYGKKIAQRMGEDFSAAGWTVVSGLAVGIDGAAHKGALTGLFGGTVGVLGCGVDVIYPPQHRQLYAEIAEKGLLLSEYPPGLSPDPRFFPQRNRIISGMSRGTIVIEARERSGALLTATSAIEQNRDLFAVPGLVTSAMSKGPHLLIRNGAKLVTCAEDVLTEYQAVMIPGVAVAQFSLTEDERSLYTLIGDHPCSADLLSERTGQPVHSLLGVLTTLQLKGAVLISGGEYHCVGSSG